MGLRDSCGACMHRTRSCADGCSRQWRCGIGTERVRGLGSFRVALLRAVSEGPRKTGR